MEIQAFVFNWRGHEENAASLAARLAARVNTRVINSDETVARRHPDWIHLGEEAYFSAQWNAARERFTGDVLLHIQADARLDEVDPVLDRARAVFQRHHPGVYEPDVDYTAIRYDRARLAPLEPDLYPVPLTDCTCWFVAGEVLRRLGPVDLALNRYGWGVCAAVAAVSHGCRRPCLRDYRFTIQHPRGRGYCSAEAGRQRQAYAHSLGPELERRMRQLYAAFLQRRAAD